MSQWNVMAKQIPEILTKFYIPNESLIFNLPHWHNPHQNEACLC